MIDWQYQYVFLFYRFKANIMQLTVTIQTDRISQNIYVFMLFMYVFVYGPFCHGALKLDVSTLFTTPV